MEIDIERQVEKITNVKTKEMFTEVYQLYAIHNYRACIVMLWSCIVCDLLYKLEESVVLHNDSIAKNILEDVNKIRNMDDFQVNWESKFIVMIRDRTKFLSDISFQQLNEIHKHRHWCAHPVFVDNYDLYMPSRELCRDSMQQALSIVFVRPSFMTKHLTTMVLESLETFKRYNPDYEILGRFLDERYMKNLPIELKKKIFRDLWHIVFSVTTDEKADANRSINMLAIRHLIDGTPNLLDLLSEEREYYSKISATDDILEMFFILSAHFPLIWNRLTESCKTILKGETERNHILDFLAVCIDENIENHFNRLSEAPIYETTNGWNGSMIYANLSINQIRTMFNISDIYGKKNSFFSFLIKMHGKSTCYDDANLTCEFIQPYLQFFDKESIDLLLHMINSNNQCYTRRGNSSTIREIIQFFFAKQY